MNKIHTYEDLLKEKQQLEVLLHAQKELLQSDIRELQGELRPAVDTISFIGKIIKRDSSNPLLNSGANRVIDFVFKKLILARSGWLTRVIVPFFLKNYSSHLIAQKKDKVIGKLFDWAGKKNANGQSAPEIH